MRLAHARCLHISQAEASFVQLLRINPHSLIVLRNYAQFLLEVVNQDEKVLCRAAVLTTWLQLTKH
jgi:hypothetical protein